MRARIDEDGEALAVEPAATVSLGLSRRGAPVPGVLACVHRDAFAVLQARRERILHPTEARRFEGFPAEARRIGFLLGRYAAKRAVLGLGRSRGASMRAVEIAPGVFEQPFVRGLDGEAPVVSLSHTRIAAVAVACEADHILGVDLEEVAPERAEVFASVMTDRELAAAAGDALATNVLWAMKEALSKALRCGLMTPFEVLESDGFGRQDDGGYGCLFRNFAQYRGQAWRMGDVVLAIVTPKYTQVGIPAAELDAVRRVMAGGKGTASAA